MRQDEKRDPGLRILGFMFGAVSLWGTTYFAASRMIDHSFASAKFRAAGVIGVLGFLFWQLATAKLILLHDEFTRRIHLIALAIVFAAAWLFIFTTDLLQRAGFIHFVQLRTIWLFMLVIWVLAILGGEWYYRR